MDHAWFRERKAELDLKDAAIADAISRDRSIVNKILNGAGEFSHEHADRLAATFRVDRAEILFRLGILTEWEKTTLQNGRPDPANDNVIEIERLDLSLSMGPGTLIGDYVEGSRIKFDLDFIRAITRTPTDRIKIVTGIGDSMYPTLSWGDQIMIDTTDNQLTRQDGIYWITIHGASGLKRLRTIGAGRVMVISDNKAVDDYEVDAADLRIDGRAIWCARGL